MAQSCRTCAHPARREIERRKHQGATLQELADAFGLSKSTINRHFGSHHHLAGFEATECPEPAQSVAKGASGRLAPSAGPPARRRAITSGPRPVKPVSLPPAAPGGAAPVPVAAHPYRATPVTVAAKTSLTTSPQELALLQAIGYNPQELAELIGDEAGAMTEFIESSRGTKRAIGEVTRPEWARQCIRLRVDFLYSLRRQQQAAMECGKFREVRAYNGDIERAMTQLVKTLQLFGFAGPVDPSEISKEGDDAREMFGVIVSAMEAGVPKPLNDDGASGFLDQERQYAESHRAIA